MRFICQRKCMAIGRIRDMDQETDGCMRPQVSYRRKTLSRDRDCVCGRVSGKTCCRKNQRTGTKHYIRLQKVFVQTILQTEI